MRAPASCDTIALKHLLSCQGNDLIAEGQRYSLCILNNVGKGSITAIVMTTEMAVAKEFASYLNKLRHLHWALQVNQRNVISFRSLRHNDQ